MTIETQQLRDPLAKRASSWRVFRVLHLASLLVFIVSTATRAADNTGRDSTSEAAAAIDRAKAAVRAGDWDAAEKRADDALRRDPAFLEGLKTRGWIRAQRGKLEAALADYDAALKLDPHAAEVWCNRGHACVKLRRFDEAAKNLAEAKRLDPNLLAAWTTSAWMHTLAGDAALAADDYAGALRLRPDDLKLRVDRAMLLRRMKRFDDAIAELDAAAARAPGDPRYLGLRGATRLSAGDYRQGAADLRAAIAIAAPAVDRATQAADSRVADMPSPSDEDLEHGRRQVERMLADRPAMAEHADAAAPLRTWAAQRFAGAAFGRPIDWSAEPPLHSDAENLAPAGRHHAEILVAPSYQSGANRGRPRGFEELWAGAIFELHNVNQIPEFARLHREAAAGNVSKEEFVKGIFRAENRAMHETRAFYLEIYLPVAEEAKLPTEPALWFAEQWDDVDAAMQGFANRNEYPWRPYARDYDWLRVRRLLRAREHAAAAELLGAMAAEAGYPEDRAEIQLDLGRCLLALGKPREAEEAAAQALKVSPRMREARTLQAQARAAQAELRAGQAKARETQPEAAEPPLQAEGK